VKKPEPVPPKVEPPVKKPEPKLPEKSATTAVRETPSATATEAPTSAASQSTATASATTSATKSESVAAATPAVELPSASAAYLKNPPPSYPALSRRLGEEGRVVLRVYIETNGSAAKAEVYTSSGYTRLDQAALEAVLRWRYVPGKRNGVPEAMWYLVPVEFKLR
jgi:protein TonB